MGRFRFELATAEDDAELRSILAAVPMDGPVAVSLRREPSFFEASAVEGDLHQVIVCRDAHRGRIAGFGCRSIRQLFVAGRPTAVGYLSGLRALPAYRNQGLVARGYAFLRELHEDGRAPFYLTTIADGNRPALATLTSRRAGLPAYHPLGTYHTLVMAPRGRAKSMQPAATAAGVAIRTATDDDLPRVESLLAKAGATRQYFPCLCAEDFGAARATLRGLSPADLVLAERRGQLVGLVGGWDQHAFKQAVVERYASHLRWSRPLLNAWAGMRGLPRLPAPGTELRYLTAAVPVVSERDGGVLAALVERLLYNVANGPAGYLAMGLHESDPLLPALQPYRAASYLTHTYLVCWDEVEPRWMPSDTRPAYLELGFL